MYYIQFEMPPNINVVNKSIKWKEFLIEFAIGILKKIIPTANPDYEEQLGNVKSWIIEVDAETSLPNREIGIDENGNPIMRLPDDNNYGYWTDNNLTRGDFENHFEVEEKTREYFFELWNKPVSNR